METIIPYAVLILMFFAALILITATWASWNVIKDDVHDFWNFIKSIANMIRHIRRW